MQRTEPDTIKERNQSPCHLSYPYHSVADLIVVFFHFHYKMADRLPTAGNAAPRNTPPPTAAAARKPSPGPCQPTLSPKFACQRAPAKSFQMPCASVALGPSVGLGRCASASRQVRISICVAPPAIRSVLRPARNYDARSWRMSTPASSGNGAQAKLAGAEQEVEATLEAGEEAKAKLGGSVKPEEQLEALQERDWAAVLTYLGATTTQFLLIRLFLRLLQFATSVGPLSQGVAPTVVVALFFATMSLKSRIFSPLDNSRCVLFLQAEVGAEERAFDAIVFNSLDGVDFCMPSPALSATQGLTMAFCPCRPTRSSEKDQIKQGKRPSWMPPPGVQL